MAKRMPDDVREYFRQQGAKGGKLGGASGGKKAASNMTAAQRKARATNASKAAAVARTKKRRAKDAEAKGLGFVPFTKAEASRFARELHRNPRTKKKAKKAKD